MNSPKPLSTVLLEAVVVGAVLVGLVKLSETLILPYLPNISGHKEKIEFFLVVGALFHLFGEYMGVNQWYSVKYCQLLRWSNIATY